VKERLDLVASLIGSSEVVETEAGEPTIEILGNLMEFSQSKRWFRDTSPRPDVG